MIRLRMLLAACSLTILAAGTHASGPQGIPVATGCEEIHIAQPMLIVHTSGSTLTGPVFQLMTVYSNGESSLSQADGLNPTPMISTTTLDLEAIAKLRADLRRANAMNLCDQEGIVLDVPLTTVTVFDGGTGKSVANTFSYWGGFGDHGEVQAAVNNLMAIHLGA